MKKILFLFVMILALFIGLYEVSADELVNTINYNLTVSDKYTEKINVYLPPKIEDLFVESVEEDHSNEYDYSFLLLNNNIRSIFSNQDKIYKKSINRSSKYIDVLLEYSYTEKEFLDSYLMQNCFEYYILNGTTDYVEIELTGEFYCLNNNILNINVNSKRKILESNGKLINNNYTWTINKDNVSDTYIYFKIENDSNNNTTKSNNNNRKNNIIKIVLLTIGLFASIGVYIFFRKKNEKNLM